MKKLLLITALFCAFSVNAQFRLVKDINTGGNNSDPFAFHEFDGKLFFSATTPTDDSIHTTDGTNAGTVNILYNSSTINIANPYSDFQFYTYNSVLYFTGMYPYPSALDPQAFVLKMTSSNNNYAQSVSLLFNYTGSKVSRLGDPIFENNKIFFNPIDINPSSSGLEPYIIDLLEPNINSNTSILKDLRIGVSSSNPENMTLFNGNVFFSAYNGSLGIELFKSDFTSAGTDLFMDINIGAGNGFPSDFNILGNQLTFVATDNTLGRELFKTTGNTGSLVLVKNINTGVGNSDPENVTRIGQILYFSADNGSVGHELWKSNGNSFGTVLIKDINPLGDSDASKFTQFGTDIYFIADDGTNGVELWKTDGTNAGTILVKNINPTGSSSPDYLTEYNGKLYFVANDGVNGNELWVTDGTTAGTTIIELDTNGDSSVSSLIVFNNELYLSADAGVGIGQELYAYQDPTLSIDDFNSIDTSISVFPNPTNNYFEIASKETLSKVEIYSLQGQAIKSFTPQNQYDISDLSSGIYLVKIQANNNEITKRIIKE